MVADIADDKPHSFLTSSEIRTVLPTNLQTGLIAPLLVQPVAGQSDQFNLIVIAFPADPSSSQPPIWIALHYVRMADELRLLAYDEALVFSPNGRFLIQWPADLFGLSVLHHNSRAWQIEWRDLVTGMEQQITWSPRTGLGTAVPAYDWSPVDDWFLLLAHNTLLLVEASAPQSGYIIPLADRLGEAYRCFDAVWMRTAN